MRRSRLIRARLITPYINDPDSAREIVIRDLPFVPQVNEIVMDDRHHRYLVAGIEWRLDYDVDWDVEIRLRELES